MQESAFLDKQKISVGVVITLPSQQTHFNVLICENACGANNININLNLSINENKLILPIYETLAGIVKSFNFVLKKIPLEVEAPID